MVCGRDSDSIGCRARIGLLVPADRVQLLSEVHFASGDGAALSWLWGNSGDASFGSWPIA